MITQRPRIIKWIALLAALACLIGSVHTTAFAEDLIDELTNQKEDLQTQQEDLQTQQEELAAQRDETAESLEHQQEQSALIREQIDLKSAEIAVNEQLLQELDNQIAQKQTAITQKEADIVSLEQEVSDNQETLRMRLRAISKKSVFSSFVQYLLGNSSYTNYLIGFKMTERVSEHDQALLDQLEQDILSIEDAKNTLKTDKAALEIERTQAQDVQNDMVADKQSLQSLYTESDTLANEMAQHVEYLNQQIAETVEQQQALQNEIDEMIARIIAEEEERRRREEEERKKAEANGETYESSGGLLFTGNGDGTMTWPTPTCDLITSSFKWREFTGTWHKGIDTACYGDAEGEPIVAAADGVVYTANDQDEWGMGYGYYMMIDHGDDSEGRRIITVYAHCSRIDITEGDTVTAGQQIGLIGNTGNSYGAHLHFEVVVDGTAVDPISNGYLSTDGIEVLA